METIPDSKIVKEAHSIVKHALSENIYNHSMRVYQLGLLYGKIKQIPFDLEELCLVSLFHDIGLNEKYRQKGKSFQIGSSSTLREYLKSETKLPITRINAMMEAIDFHFLLKPRWEKGELAGLLQTAAHMDVLGRNSSSIPRGDRKRIVNHYPKKRFFLEFNLCLLKSFTSVNSVIGLFSPEKCCDDNHYLKAENLA